VYPGRFDYHAPTSLAEAIQILVEREGMAKILAGGASLIPLMKLRLAEPSDLVDLGRVPGLGGVDAEDGGLRIGAMVREAELAGSEAARAHPIIADACAVIADPLVRNVGTIGGNIAHGDPANDQPAVLLALDARFVLHGPGGVREVASADFHRGLFETALEPDEILTAIRIPSRPPGSGSAYVKFERQVGDFAIAAAGAVVRLVDGRVSEARVTLTNLDATPVRATAVEATLADRAPTDAVIAEAAAAVDVAIEPWDDLRATAAIKRRMARAATERVIRRAVERAGAIGAVHEEVA
jgi:carbon-monoxide dehydrogenase medium subunit